MWNGIGWYGFIGGITTSTTDISLCPDMNIKVTAFTESKKFYYTNRQIAIFFFQLKETKPASLLKSRIDSPGENHPLRTG